MQCKQAGMTLLGFIIVLAVVGFFAYIGMKLFPLYSEYYAVKQSLAGVAKEPGIARQDPSRIKDAFFRRLYINYSENVQKNDIKVVRAGGGVLDLRVDYEVRKPLIGNLDVVAKFQASQRLGDVDAGD